MSPEDLYPPSGYNHTNLIGQTLSYFRITAKLGEGGMGEVYRAEDTKLKREVALKVLPTELAGSQERLGRFQREAETLAALDHPNIVTIYSVEQVEGVHFLTMQLVEGKPLSELIPTDGLPLERIFEIAMPLTEALAAAHAKGVIHRDLKPSNIMVTNDGGVKVLDFGLAKIGQAAGEGAHTQMPTELLTEENRILGTLGRTCRRNSLAARISTPAPTSSRLAWFSMKWPLASGRSTATLRFRPSRPS